MAKARKVPSEALWELCSPALSVEDAVDGPTTRELAQTVTNDVLMKSDATVDWISMLERVDAWLRQLKKLGLVTQHEALKEEGPWAHRWALKRKT